MKNKLLILFSLLLLAGCSSIDTDAMNTNFKTIIDNQATINANLKSISEGQVTLNKNIEVIVKNQITQDANLKIMQENILENCVK